MLDDTLKNMPRHSAISIANALCSRLTWEVEGLCRANTPEDDEDEREEGPFIRLTEWRYRGGFTKSIFKDNIVDTIFREKSPEFSPVAA
ncbi:hypothetical protein AWENTII_006539 [Aspergillus wentii]